MFLPNRWLDGNQKPSEQLVQLSNSWAPVKTKSMHYSSYYYEDLLLQPNIIILIHVDNSPLKGKSFLYKCWHSLICSNLLKIQTIMFLCFIFKYEKSSTVAKTFMEGNAHTILDLSYGNLNIMKLIRKSQHSNMKFLRTLVLML